MTKHDSELVDEVANELACEFGGNDKTHTVLANELITLITTRQGKETAALKLTIELQGKLLEEINLSLGESPELTCYGHLDLPELVEKLIKGKDGWISVETDLPLMQLREDDRGGGRWYISDQHIWATDGVKVIDTSFFQVWPDRGKAVSIGMLDITHWMPYELPALPESTHE